MAPIDLWTRWGWRHEYAAARPRGGAAAAAADVADRAGSSSESQVFGPAPIRRPRSWKGEGEEEQRDGKC